MNSVSASQLGFVAPMHGQNMKGRNIEGRNMEGRSRWALLLERINQEQHELVLWLYMIIVFGHWVEHLTQVYQVYMLGWLPKEAGGVLGLWLPGLAEAEVLHFTYNSFLLGGILLLRAGFKGRALRWWNWALMAQSWHFFEHTLLQIQWATGVYLFGASEQMGIGQLWLPRVELHFLYNLIVFTPMVIGMVYYFQKEEGPGERRAILGRLKSFYKTHTVQRDAAQRNTAQPYTPNVQRLLDAVMGSEGGVSSEFRQSAAALAAQAVQGMDEGISNPVPLEEYIRKVGARAYRITDSDIAALKATNYTEDEIFELTISAAVGASLTQLNCGTAALNSRRFQPVNEKGGN